MPSKAMPATGPLENQGRISMNKIVTRRSVVGGIGAGIFLRGTCGARADRKYGVGVTDTEIKLGTTSPYSGPASAYGVFGQTQSAYFQMINDQGGINGRKVNLISLDNAYSPPKALEQTRKLVESDEVFAIAGFLGTAPNVAVQKYLNSNSVPSIFLTSGAERFNDPKNFPWIVPFHPTFVSQGAAYGQYLIDRRPNAKIAVHYLNDDLGRDFLRGLRTGLGGQEKLIIKQIPHELTDPTIDGAIVELRATGADVLVQLTTSKFVAQGIRKVAELGWKPTYIIASIAAGIGATLVPAGPENSKGVITARWLKHPMDPGEVNSSDVADYKAFVAKYMPRLDIEDDTAVVGYVNAYMISLVLRRCGNDLSRENLLVQATNINESKVPMVLEGLRIFNSPTNYLAYHSLQLAQFDGKHWVSLGDTPTTN
jgi:branched-chain amino acid transport system substrate-binding protein